MSLLPRSVEFRAAKKRRSADFSKPDNFHGKQSETACANQDTGPAEPGPGQRWLEAPSPYGKRRPSTNGPQYFDEEGAFPFSKNPI